MDEKEVDFDMNKIRVTISSHSLPVVVLNRSTKDEMSKHTEIDDSDVSRKKRKSPLLFEYSIDQI